MNPQSRSHFDWRLPFWAAVAVVLVFVPLLLSPTFELWEIFFHYAGVPIALLILLVVAATRRSVSVLAMAVVVALMSYLIYANQDAIRFTGRWALWSHQYKKAAKAQQAVAGELPHAEWDGWGFAGLDTTVYAVFDASDSLYPVAQKHMWGKVPGIPCPVSSVYRLEKHWYSVVMYTNSDWNQCE
jgi:hypothetical protein